MGLVASCMPKHSEEDYRASNEAYAEHLRKAQKVADAVQAEDRRFRMELNAAIGRRKTKISFQQTVSLDMVEYRNADEADRMVIQNEEMRAMEMGHRAVIPHLPPSLPQAKFTRR